MEEKEITNSANYQGLSTDKKPGSIKLAQIILGIDALFAFWGAYIIYTFDAVDIITGQELIKYEHRVPIALLQAVIGLFFIIVILGIQKRRRWSFYTAVIFLLAGLIPGFIILGFNIFNFIQNVVFTIIIVILLFKNRDYLLKP